MIRVRAGECLPDPSWSERQPQGQGALRGVRAALIGDHEAVAFSLRPRPIEVAERLEGANSGEVGAVHQKR